MATEFPESAVKEGTTTVFKCSSDEGNPLPLIRWNQGIGNAKVKPGKFNASRTESALRLEVDRTLNGEEIICFIDKNETNGQMELEGKKILTVICESFFHLFKFIISFCISVR